VPLRSNILFLLILFNFLPLFAVYRAVSAWVQPESRRRKVLVAAGLVTSKVAEDKRAA